MRPYPRVDRARHQILRATGTSKATPIRSQDLGPMEQAIQQGAKAFAAALPRWDDFARAFAQRNPERQP